MTNPFEAKPLNAWQQKRAPQQHISDSAFADMRQELADQQIFNKHTTYSNEITDPETGIKTKIYFDRKSDVWRAEFTFRNGEVQTLEADSRDELLLAIAVGHAKATVEVREAVEEQNPVFKNKWHRACHEWMTYGKWGNRFSEWVEYLPQDTVNEIFALLRQKASRMFGKGATASPRNLEAAYCELLDAGLLDAFENEAATNKKVADTQAAKDAEQQRVTAERVAAEEAGYNNALAEHQVIEATERIAAERKLSKTRKGMAELRRRALFGDKTNAFPISTGMGQRI